MIIIVLLIIIQGLINIGTILHIEVRYSACQISIEYYYMFIIEGAMNIIEVYLVPMII